jgi:FkbM family methyltransferase
VNFGNNIEPKIIIDCGANIGLSTLYFRRQFPNSVIISIEPELSNFNMLLKNTSNYDKIDCLHAAVWNKNSKVNVIDNGGGVASFITKEPGEDGNIIEQITSFTIPEIMSKYSVEFIDLIKMDIEGSEFELFDYNPKEWTGRINMLAVELHEGLKPGVTHLINSKMNDTFINYQVGEYRVFKRK